jgi:hypothetical protein
MSLSQKKYTSSCVADLAGRLQIHNRCTFTKDDATTLHVYSKFSTMHMPRSKNQYLKMRTRMCATSGSDDTKSSSDEGSSIGDFAAYDGGGGRDAPFRLPERRLPARGALLTPLVPEDLTPELQERVLRVMVDAFDNLPPPEVATMLAALWAAGPAAGPAGDTLPRLVRLTEEVEAIEAAAIARVRGAGGAMGLEDLEDAIRVARSRVRMSGRDADYHTGALSLDPWRLPWQ